MSDKSYLSEQINLMTLTTLDLMTDEEFEVYKQIVNCINKIGEEDIAIKENSLHDPAIRQEAINQKKANQEKLDKLIQKHNGIPRVVQYKRLLDTRRLERDENDEIIWPPGITWNALKTSRKISEFVSAESRIMGLKPGEITFDKIIVKWKSLDILKQIVLDGFIVPIQEQNDTVTNKHLIFLTASSGQLRTDKTQFIEENTWNRIKSNLMNGLTFEEINDIKINCNKLMAYLALSSSASIEWHDVTIDNVIVVEDFENEITEEFDNIDEQYNIKREIRTVKIKQSDGIGMMLPSVSRKNFQLRSIWLKGLLTSFDFIKFCEVNNCPAKLVDIYGVEHDLIEENIKVILFKSQFKLYKYYKNWEDYKQKFKENNCVLNITNIEEDYIANSPFNYQFCQSLVHMTDEEIDEFVKPTHEKIENITKNQESMLKALKADVNSENPYKRSLAIYPELLKEAYTKETLKDIKTRWLLDAKSGKIYCENKRLFAVPDMYAICEYLFLHDSNPKGLLQSHEVAAKCLRNKSEMDFLRSPHLSMEHWIATVVPDQEVYNWFYTNGLYMSCHDSMIKRLQGDVDGDTINCVYNKWIVQAAKRELEIQDVRTLNYELGKAPDTVVTNEEMYNGLKRAHEYSGIGQVSNNITKIYNRDDPDVDMTKILCYFNNQVNYNCPFIWRHIIELRITGKV